LGLSQTRFIEGLGVGLVGGEDDAGGGTGRRVDPTHARARGSRNRLVLVERIERNAFQIRAVEAGGRGVNRAGEVRLLRHLAPRGFESPQGTMPSEYVDLHRSEQACNIFLRAANFRESAARAAVARMNVA